MRGGETNGTVTEICCSGSTEQRAVNEWMDLMQEGNATCIHCSHAKQAILWHEEPWNLFLVYLLYMLE